MWGEFVNPLFVNPMGKVVPLPVNVVPATAWMGFAVIIPVPGPAVPVICLQPIRELVITIIPAQILTTSVTVRVPAGEPVMGQGVVSILALRSPAAVYRIVIT